MRSIIIAISLLLSANVFSADRYWVGGGSSANWNATGPTNWAATSGGAGNQTVPGASDNVFFDGSGNSASTISTSITVLSFTIVSGYTSTITHIGTLTVAGNIKLATGYTVAGTTGITISAASTMTSGGKTWPNNITLSGAFTRTLADNWTISGALLLNGAAQVFNATTSETFTCAGVTMQNTTAAGTAKIIMSGGTWSGSSVLINDLDIAGNVTVSGSVAFNTKTLTYVSGTVTTTGSALTLGGSCTMNTNGITWNNITSTNTTTTLTLNSNLTLSGTFTISGGSNFTFAGSGAMTCATFAGTSTGGGVVTFNDGVTYTVTNALTFNTTRVGSKQSFTSDHASNKAFLVLSPGATCNVLLNFTRMDASGGRTIRSFNGTITDCVNILAFNDIGTNKH